MTYRQTIWISLNYTAAACVGMSLILLINHYITTKTVPNLSILFLVIAFTWIAIGYIATFIGEGVEFVLYIILVTGVIGLAAILTGSIIGHCARWWSTRVWFRSICTLVSVITLGGVWVFIK